MTRFISPTLGWAAFSVALGWGSIAHASSSITIMVPMRDGVRLATDVYRVWPYDARPTILVRTPYDRKTDVGAVDEDWLDRVYDEGYAYVVQDVRGRFDSEGNVPLYSSDAWGELQDGYDTIEWVAAQPWCNGDVAMWGESARGIMQYFAAGTAPPSLRACVTSIACEDFYRKAFFQGGGFRESLVLDWFDSVNRPEDADYFLSHPLRDEFWDQFDIYTRLDQIQVPMLHIGGLYDIFGDSAIDAFRALQWSGAEGAAGNQQLIMGPWSHRNINQINQSELAYANGTLPLDDITFRWLDYWMKGENPEVANDPAVRYFVMGDPLGTAGNYWVVESDFGVGATPVPLYLHGPLAGSQLQPYPSSVSGDSFVYTTDPASPRTTRGGRNLFLTEGPYDQRPVFEGRTDGLVLSTIELLDPVTIVGKVTLELFAGSSTPDTDFCATLVDVYPDGRHMYVTDGILRARHRNGFEDETFMEAGEVYEFSVDLWSTAYAFDVGHRIGLILSNTNSRRFEVNDNVGAPFGQGSAPLPADITIYAGADYPSRLVLPFGTPELVAVGDPTPPTLSVHAAVNPAPRFDIGIEGLGDRAGLAVVVDAAGRVVRSFEIARGGSARGVRWDGTTSTGRRAASGVYTFVVRTDRGAIGKQKLVLVR